MTRTIYLKSYDKYVDVLEYQVPEGKFAIIPRDQFETCGIPYTFGHFCSEGLQVAGIFATPDGPIIFLDSQQVLGRFGESFATVKDVPGAKKKYFTFRPQCRRQGSGEVPPVVSGASGYRRQPV